MNADTVFEALELADWTMRYEHPDWFDRVDAIKAQPGWEPFANGNVTALSGIGYRGKIGDCAWCGADFPIFTSAHPKCCSAECGQEYREWKKRRIA